MTTIYWSRVKPAALLAVVSLVFAARAAGQTPSTAPLPPPQMPPPTPSSPQPPSLPVPTEQSSRSQVFPEGGLPDFSKLLEAPIQAAGSGLFAPIPTTPAVSP